LQKFNDLTSSPNKRTDSLKESPMALARISAACLAGCKKEAGRPCIIPVHAWWLGGLSAWVASHGRLRIFRNQAGGKRIAKKEEFPPLILLSFLSM
jgi:hypothetical protein